MESLLDKLSRNQKRIWRFILIAVCVSVAAFIVFPYIGVIFLRLGLINLPDIGDSNPQAYQPPDSPFETVFIAIFKIILFPASAVEFICNKTGIDPRSFPFIAPGLFWAFLVELLFVAKKRLWLKKPQDK
jgi:hypothetical protein